MMVVKLPVYHKGHLTDDEAHYALTNHNTRDKVLNGKYEVRFFDYHWGLDPEHPRGHILHILHDNENVNVEVEIPENAVEEYEKLENPIIRMDTYGYGKKIKILNFTFINGKYARRYDRVVDPKTERFMETAAIVLNADAQYYAEHLGEGSIL